jgi:glycine C-acetyltransferase
MRNPTSFLKQEYDDLVRQEIDWRLRILGGPSTPWCLVDGKKVLMFCSNNYLGLSNHPKLKEADAEVPARFLHDPETVLCEVSGPA